ncbi:MAG: acyltransferase [Myxococcota bacterium]
MKSRLYLPSLDGLRFIAFLLVFIHHSPPFVVEGARNVAVRILHGIQSRGWIGVDLFFALSAYLLTRLLCREHAAFGSIDLRSFYVRRALRIWPLHFFAVLVGTLLLPLAGVLGPAWTTEEHTQLVQRHTIANVLLMGNYSAGIWGYAPSKMMSALWSISLEEQFYLFWPWTLRYVLKRSPWARLLILLGMVLLSVTAKLCLASVTQHPFLWTATFCRLEPFVIGAALALAAEGLLPVRFRQPSPFAALMALMASVALVAALPNVDSQGLSSIALFGAAACFAGSLLPLALAEGSTMMRVLGSPPARWMGTVTYGLYVYHIAAFAIVGGEVEQTGLQPGAPLTWFVTTLAALLLTGALARVSYALLERPFVRMKDRYARILSRPP